MMVGGNEGNSFPAPKPLIQKKQVIRRAGRLSAHRIAHAAQLSGCALAADDASGGRRDILIGEAQ
jgi:hypothetical protein